MSDQARDASLSDLESKLTSLTPQPSALDRDYVLYHAGRASVRQGWFWQATTGFLVVVVAVLTLALLYRPIPHSEPLVIHVPADAPAPRSAPITYPDTRPSESNATYMIADMDRARTESDSLRRRDEVLRFGIESVPELRPTAAADKPLPLDPLLGLPASSLADDSSRRLLRPSLHAGH